MKAYRAYEVGGEGATIVFAETASQAKSVAKACDCCEDARWTDVRVNREPRADSLYKGQSEIDWYDPETRLVLVRDLGWACYEPSFECDSCNARKFCSHWEDERHDT